MQGNYGPDSKMDTALGAYTPNVPWAQIDCEKIVDMDGAGTSAATPQIAAAAALWLAEHFDTVSAYPAALDAGGGGPARAVLKGRQVNEPDECRAKRGRRSDKASSRRTPRSRFCP